MEPFIGQIIMFGGNFAPRGWALCDGALLAISSNSALFSILGTTYGGDGRTSFALPDLRGRVAIHAGNGPGLSNRNLGQKGGAENHTMSVNEMPSHNHTGTLRAEGVAGTSGNPTDQLLSIVNTGDTKIYAAADPASEINMHADSIVVGNNGGGQSFGIEQPYLAVNYIIALQGIFPSRN